MALTQKSEGNSQELILSFTMWVPGIELRSVGLEPGAFTHCAISLALFLYNT